MIILFTDFGIGSPYQASLKASLRQHGATQTIVNLHADLKNFHIQAAAYLLPAYVKYFPPGSTFLCVLDPGVGSARLPLVIQCAERWFVGPDNGLFQLLMQRFPVRCWRIIWQPAHLSQTFHGRDLFAPTAAQISRGDLSGLEEIACTDLDGESAGWPDDLWQIIYIDHYGNLYTGVRANQLPHLAQLCLHKHVFNYARTYSEVDLGQAFWYENSIGLVEIAINQGSAAAELNVQIGDNMTLASL